MILVYPRQTHTSNTRAQRRVRAVSISTQSAASITAVRPGYTSSHRVLVTSPCQYHLKYGLSRAPGSIVSKCLHSVCNRTTTGNTLSSTNAKVWTAQAAGQTLAKNDTRILISAQWQSTAAPRTARDERARASKGHIFT